MTRKRRYCPTLEDAPQTLEGEAAWAAAIGQGVWKRAGMGGVVTGLDMAEALARITDPESLNLDAVRFCLAQIEIGRLAAEVQSRDNSNNSETN